MTAGDARALFRHMQWADAAIWNAVHATHGGLTDEGLKTRLHHIHLVQRVYLQIWLWMGKPDPAWPPITTGSTRAPTV